MRPGDADVCKLPGVAAEEELAECAVPVHQVLHGQALSACTRRLAPARAALWPVSPKRPSQGCSAVVISNAAQAVVKGRAVAVARAGALHEQGLAMSRVWSFGDRPFMPVHGYWIWKLGSVWGRGA